MELTAELAATFVGGQLEVQNEVEGYLYRGEIATATVEEGTLKINLVWMTKGEGFLPPLPERWVSDNSLTYDASLSIYGVGDIGDGRISLNCWVVHELAVLYPPGGSKLDPAKVEGLQLVS